MGRAPAVLLTAAATASVTTGAALDPRFAVRAAATASQLVTCAYNASSGVWPAEDLWQSGNTIETLARLQLVDPARNNYTALFANTFALTPVIVDQCFDDHQWWELAWIRAYQATGTLAYLQRAAAVFDYVVQHAWTSLCGGGVLWCPNGSPYKNAITNELVSRAAERRADFALVPSVHTRLRRFPARSS
jgi:hypothetical protein